MAEEDGHDVFIYANYGRFHKELRDHAEQHPGTVITQETYANIVAWKKSNAPKGQRGQVGTAHERKTWRDKGYELQSGDNGELRLMMPDKRHGRLLEVVPLPRIAESLHYVHAVLIGHHGQNKTKQKVREMYYGIPVEPLVPLFINSCRVCGIDMPHDEPKASKDAYQAPSEEGGDEEAEVAASKADRVALPEKTRTGRRVAMPTRFTDVKDSSKPVTKRRASREQAAARADAIVKLEYEGGAPGSRAGSAGSAGAEPSHSAGPPGRGKHRRKFGAPRRAAI